MTTAWTRRIALGLLCLGPLACEVRVNRGDPNDGSGGDDDSFATAGAGGRTSSGNGGRDSAGGLSSGNGGASGGEIYPAPTCSEEDGDEQDACVQCLKRECCTAWLRCDDQTCFEEWNDVAQCVSNQSFPDADQYRMCVSESAASMDGLPQENTLTLLDCLNEPRDSSDAGFDDTTRCGQECFETDIFFE
jgi:hypothetical protein